MPFSLWARRGTPPQRGLCGPSVGPSSGGVPRDFHDEADVEGGADPLQQQDHGHDPPASRRERAGNQIAGGVEGLRGAGRGLPGATVRARIPSVARSALSGITGKIAASFQLCSAADQS